MPSNFPAESAFYNVYQVLFIHGKDFNTRIQINLNRQVIPKSYDRKSGKKIGSEIHQ